MIHRAQAKSFVKGSPLVPDRASLLRERFAGHGMIRSRRKSENIRRNISSVSSGETYKTGVARGLVAGVRYIAIPTIAGALFSYRRAA